MLTTTLITCNRWWFSIYIFSSGCKLWCFTSIVSSIVLLMMTWSVKLKWRVMVWLLLSLIVIISMIMLSIMFNGINLLQAWILHTYSLSQVSLSLQAKSDLLTATTHIDSYSQLLLLMGALLLITYYFIKYLTVNLSFFFWKYVKSIFLLYLLLFFSHLVMIFLNNSALSKRSSLLLYYRLENFIQLFLILKPIIKWIQEAGMKICL